MISRPSYYRDNIDLELIENWAINFPKLIGKFGSQLLHTPDSIYKTILRFCPANSMSYKQFLRQSNRYLTATGVSQDWDDSLARLSFSIELEATALIAEGEWIAVASLSLDNKSIIFLYSSTTYQKARQIHHGEKVRKMSCNSIGTLLVTCGLSTTKVWDLSTGGCITTVLNPLGCPRPQTIIFCHNDEVLLIGTDDRRVWSLSFLNPNPRFEELIWITETVATGGFANSPGLMALSPDGRLLALGYRQRPLSIWDLESQELVRYCSDLGRVTQMIWHPYSGDLYGLMLHVGSQVFKLCADDDVPSAFYIEASTIAMSLDGNLLAIGDQYGNVKLLSAADISILYQLVSQDPVLGLAFSVGGNQIYDIRLAYGNIWEQNILLKLSGPEVQLSEETRENRSTNFFSIQKIAWSSDERNVCYADVSRTVCVDPVTYDSNSGTVNIKRVLKLSIKYLKDNIDDLIFHPGSLMLLVCTSSAVAVISIELATIVASREIKDVGGKWTSHPGNNEDILFINSQSVKVFTWSSLKEIGLVPLDTDEGKYFQVHDTAQGHTFLDSHIINSSIPTRDNNFTVSGLVFSSSKQHILLKLSTVDRRNYVRLLDISNLNSAVLRPLST